jgi:hypothetical protein
MDGSLRNFEPAGEIAPGHPAIGLKQEEGGEQPVAFHD